MKKPSLEQGCHKQSKDVSKKVGPTFYCENILVKPKKEFKCFRCDHEFAVCIQVYKVIERALKE